jgi:hypothetical protein
MPAQNRVRRDNRRHLRQQPTPQSRAADGQAPPVVVGEPQTLVLQQRPEHAVLFAEVLDDVVLFALEPAEEGHDEELQRNHTAESMPNSAAQFFGHYGLLRPCYQPRNRPLRDLEPQLHPMDPRRAPE